MLTRIAMLLSGLNMGRFTQVLASLKVRLCKLVSNLRVSCILASLSVASLFNSLRVQTASSFNRLRVSLTTAVQSIKAGLSTVKAKLIQLGLQLLTTVRQILQHVTIAYKKSKEHVAKIKLVLSRISGSKIVQTLMAHQLIQAGLKLVGTARQRLQRVQRQLFKGR